MEEPELWQILQELKEDDTYGRQFCKEFTQFIDKTPMLFRNICFIDKCTFIINGTVNN